MGLGCMRSSSRAGIAFSLTIVAVVVGLHLALEARQPDSEQDLLVRFEREQKPVKKSIYATRLAQLKLQQATDAYAKDDLDQGQKLLDEYLKWVKSSWDLLKSSGRPAERKPQGFKELDIALREDARHFADLEHRVPFTDREPVAKAAQEAEKIRGEVLAVLFPTGESGAGNKSGGPGSKPAPPPHFRSNRGYGPRSSAEHENNHTTALSPVGEGRPLQAVG